MKWLRLACPSSRSCVFFYKGGKKSKEGSSLWLHYSVSVTAMKMWNVYTFFFFFSATTSQKNADLDAVINRIEVLVASIKRRSQRLYKDTDGSKGRARIRRKIREEKAILSSVVEKYNSMVPDTERIAFDIILSDETVWPWQLSHGGMYTNLLTILFNSQ